MKNTQPMFFDVEKIYENYRMVQADFDRINRSVNCERDAFDDSVVRNLMLAFNYLNIHLKAGSGQAILRPDEMLELNAIIHLGSSREARKEYKGFLEQTKEKVDKYLPGLLKWYKRHEHNKDDPYKIAAGLYVRVLAAPQLFYDGNHRTGALIANYYLLAKGLPPFVMTVDNAVDFLNLASDVKFKKNDLTSKFKRVTGWKDEVHAMRAFLKENARPFTTPVFNEWEDVLPQAPVRYVVTDSVRKLEASFREAQPG